jgi:hypothetical protein
MVFVYHFTFTPASHKAFRLIIYIMIARIDQREIRGS